MVRLIHIFLISILAHTSHATLYLSVRGSEDRLKSHCAQFKCLDSIINSKAVEFDNGNTFVKLATPVAGQPIEVFANAELSANQFMELLITLRALKNEFAGSLNVNLGSKLVVIKSKDGQPLIESSFAKELIYLSGANTIQNLYPVPYPKARSALKHRSQGVLLGSSSIQAVNQLAESLNIPRIDSQDISTLSPDQRVFQYESFNEDYNENFLRALDRLKKINNKKSAVTLITPYLPYARSDKKDQKGVAISGRLAADLIEAAGADSVVFVRAHAPQSEGFFSIPTLQISGRKTINDFLRSREIEVVVSPDAGFQKDASLYADDLKIPVSVINKQRNLETGKAEIKGISGFSVKGKRVVIIDDETASGSTLAKAAELLKSIGAVYVVGVVTHLAGSADQALQSPFLDEVVVTDSLPIKDKSGKLQVLSLTNEIAEEIKNTFPIPKESSTSCRARVMGF
jgi:ribose-phosphate pyrophosphokinase